MLITLYGIRPSVPEACAFCGNPFHRVEGAVQIWRSTTGQCFCSEFCADDAEEAQFQKLHATTFSVATHSTRF